MDSLSLTPSQVKSKSDSVVRMEAGVYPAVISSIIDLGVQRNIKYDSRKKPESSLTNDDYTEKHELWFSFSFPTERYTVTNDEGEEFEFDPIRGGRFNMSNNKKSKLQKMYTAVVKDGRSYGDMLGMGCTCTFEVNDNGNISLSAVTQPMKGSKLENPLIEPFVVGQDNYDQMEDLGVPEFLQNLVNSRINQ